MTSPSRWVGGGRARRGSKKSIKQLIYKGFSCSIFALFPLVFPSVGGLNPYMRKPATRAGSLGIGRAVAPPSKAPARRLTPCRYFTKNSTREKGAGFEARRNCASPVACVVDAAAAASTGVEPCERTLPASACPRQASVPVDLTQPTGATQPQPKSRRALISMPSTSKPSR